MNLSVAKRYMAFVFGMCIGLAACPVSFGQQHADRLELLPATGSPAIADVLFPKQIPGIRQENNGPKSPAALTVKNGPDSTCESSCFKIWTATASDRRDISRSSQNRIDRLTLLAQNVRLQI
ncbi:MAG TPA: hypothetical protein VHK01_16050 [Lacipirellulaceae bacterium]|jgi:hypothetical protein|nr:hypothetical protein [Lacipirellulaceae bacterium]